MTPETVAQSDITNRLADELSSLRSTLEQAFGRDTALSNSKGHGPSAGQCAATAVVLNSILGGEFVSTRINDESHWFNRLRLGTALVDVDITGDQFGFPKIQMRPAGELYPNTRVRTRSEVNEDTWRRATILAARSHLRLK